MEQEGSALALLRDIEGLFCTAGLTAISLLAEGSERYYPFVFLCLFMPRIRAGLDADRAASGWCEKL